MILRHRPLTTWPGVLLASHDRTPSPFDSSWSDTLNDLDRELHALDADPATVVLQLAVGERDCRLDGQLRADARPKHPGVILSFESAELGSLSYPCDTFDRGSVFKRHDLAGWQVNVRAIALGLEALRRVDRYGIAPGRQQYTGWKALGAGASTAMGPGLTLAQAAALLVEAADDGHEIGDLVNAGKVDPGHLASAWRAAVKSVHPDAGGDPAVFRRLQEAKAVLDRAAS